MKHDLTPELVSARLAILRQLYEDGAFARAAEARLSELRAICDLTKALEAAGDAAGLRRRPDEVIVGGKSEDAAQR